ncbi:MAG: hypothetical protein ACRBFS_25800 [Aureispira sp.]
MYFYDENLQNHYRDLSKQELLDDPPKGVGVRTPKRGVLEIEVFCFRLLPFLAVLLPLLFSFYMLYVGGLLLWSNPNLLTTIFGIGFLLLAAWIWYTKPMEVLAYSWGKVRLQLSAKGVETPLYVGERLLRTGVTLTWEAIEKITIENSTASRADNEKEIRIYQEDGRIAYLYDYYTQKQLFYVLALLQLYHFHCLDQTGTNDPLDLMDFSDHLLEE